MNFGKSSMPCRSGGKSSRFWLVLAPVGKNIEPLAAAVRKAFRNVTGLDPLPLAPQEVVSMWRDNNVFNEAGISSLTFGPPRRREIETNRLCFEIDDLANMANVYAQVASAICQ